MTRRSSRVGDVLRDATSLDPANVDRLYGLEPIYEPDDAAAVTALPFVELQCPSCGETIGTHIDVSGGSRTYIEDCQVCCRPMEIHVECGSDGNLQSAWAQRSE